MTRQGSSTGPVSPIDPERETAVRLARWAGLLYLVIIGCAGFAEGYVRSSLVVPGDPVATADRIVSSVALFRWGFFADLVAFVADAAVAVLLYVLLRPVSRTVALLAAAFRLVAHPAIAAVNLMFHLAALRILDPAGPLAGTDPAELQRLALLALDLHGYGYVVAGAFFGVHCALLGWLLYASDRFPRVLGVLLGAASVGYLLEGVAAFVAPALQDLAGTLVVATAGIGEVTLCLYLLVRGVRRPGARVGPVATA